MNNFGSKRVLFFGSRYWNNYNKVLSIMKTLKDVYGDVLIIEGGCKGADILAKRAAIECNIPYEEYKANWNIGKIAGPLRNQRMVDEGKPDMAFCFHNDIENSKGSKDMYSRLTKHNIPCEIIKEKYIVQR